ncbi:Crp/Fnr family transcriptional regulator [Mangrovimonas aestuarii]|uniref:Crp/Fnr family transcriptional regulator n=1 Tax=Mangrovimonas aestuarii TaxID=3018443 RepID=UPI0023781EFA|nr:Crp/Fnr family transcriptional regulator [Mangrovimonas aestuarii]
MKHKKISLCLFFLEKIIPLSADFKSFFHDRIQHTIYKKGELLNKSGEICDKLYFVKKGMIRGYHVIEGKEITTWLSTDGEFVTSITGFFKNETAKENIQIIEDTALEYLSYDDLLNALEIFPEMNKIYTSLLIEYYIHAENRTLMSRIPSAKGRFNHFLENGNKFLLNRAPHKYLASMLNIRPETFSRMLRELTVVQ